MFCLWSYYYVWHWVGLWTSTDKQIKNLKTVLYNHSDQSGKASGNGLEGWREIKGDYVRVRWKKENN